MAEQKKYEVTVEQVKNWFKDNDIRKPSDDWIQEYVNNPDEERREQYKEAVIEGYSRMDFEHWQHFQDVIGTTCSFACFLKCADALEEDDIAIFDLDDRPRQAEPVHENAIPAVSRYAKFPLEHYDEAIAHLREVLNEIDEGLDHDDVRTPIEIEDFIPLFSSTNYFGIYCYHADHYYDGPDEYYLVNKASGERTMVLSDNFAFVGTNLLSCMEGEKILHIANREFLRYLIDGCERNAQGVVPDEELAGIAVLDTALREEQKKWGFHFPYPSLADRIKSASNRAAAETSSKATDKGCEPTR